jgi:lipopolysaccharide/colanic/teichoic acid biosynthesis glycosyltransferase
MSDYSRSSMKRLLDLAIAVPGLIVLSPVLLLISVLIAIGDRGPVFFTQERVGKGGSRFRMYKFRTMITRAEKVGGQLTVRHDKRITRIGRLLRKTKIDELPQLLNVVFGDMSLVGPRPEVPRYVDMYTPEQREVLQLPPGITDPASIKYRSESDLLARSEDPERTYVEQIMPDKITLNLEYAEHASLAGDLRLILETLLTVAAGRDPGGTAR